jgi:Ca2+-binding RTX toxin-like protein
MSLAPSAGVFAKIQDPSKPGKTSLIVQGSFKNETIVVKPVSASNLTSYTVSMTGLATQVFTGITGRILAYASGGDDTINVSAVKISTLLSGGEGNDIILGGSAADTIFGNGGNDLLIGGLGADIINGDYGNDILVDGSVTLKSKTDTLDKVLATWNSLPAPTTSIYNNITARLSVVFDKLNKDTMGGGNGIDWFWSTSTGAVADTIGIFTGEKRRTI